VHGEAVLFVVPPPYHVPAAQFEHVAPSLRQYFPAAQAEHAAIVI